MTYEQLKWAISHDWYRDHFVVASGYVIVTRGDTDKAVNVFTEFGKLREWAGY